MRLLPEIARAIAEPLSRIDRITMVNTGGNGEIGVFDTFDVTYRLNLESIGSTLSLSALNVFDKDPSFYRATIPYNTAYGSPLGRT